MITIYTSNINAFLTDDGERFGLSFQWCRGVKNLPTPFYWGKYWHDGIDAGLTRTINASMFPLQERTWINNGPYASDYTRLAIIENGYYPGIVGDFAPSINGNVIDFNEVFNVNSIPIHYRTASQRDARGSYKISRYLPITDLSFYDDPNSGIKMVEMSMSDAVVLELVQ